jgi:putative nucleotidyltransferase with HDIG domain
MPSHFLTVFARALSTMALYADGHPERARAVEASYLALLALQGRDQKPAFTFLGDEVVYGRRSLRDRTGWEWARRLAEAGVQRLEFEPGISRAQYEDFLSEVLARVTLSAAQGAGPRSAGASGIRFGSVGVRGEGSMAALPTATTSGLLSLAAEAAAIRWVHDEVKEQRQLPMAEAEAVVRSLSVAMHADQRAILPLLKLRRFDEYTTTHALNVAVLTMALTESMGLPPAEVRAFGIAGLLHDIGKVHVPEEVLTKPGKLTDQERALMNTHPVEGARILLEQYRNLELAAVVAYEHHINADGQGYPQLRFGRVAHPASRLVHVCDVYDALRTNRPYRDAWDAARTLEYIRERAGIEFDAEFADGFLRMMGAYDEVEGAE